MKINWKAILGIAGGLGLAGAGAYALCKKNADDEDYVDAYVPEDEEVDVDSDAEEAE